MANTEVIDDSKEITIELAVAPPIVGYPKVVITNIDYPSSVEAGKSFDITIYWRNEGESGTAWLRVIDLDTGEEIVSRQTWSVTAGEEGSKIITFTMPSRNVRLRVEMGHVE